MNKDVVNSRTGVGAGIGAVIGFMFGGPVGAGVGALVGGGVAHVSGDPQRGVMTPKRKLIYAQAMATIKDPAELRKLAAAFHGEGLHGEGQMLQKRAALRELPDDTKDKRRAAFRKAMASDNADVIAQIAAAFETEGAIDAAKTLRDHADAVRAAHAAGKSTKPLTGGSQAQFAEKLAKAIIHFGPTSPQAKTAARNLTAARGKTPTDALITEVIRVAANALKVDAPRAVKPKAPIAIDATASASDGVAEDTGAPEPTTVGPPAAPVEAPAIDSGAAPPAAVETVPDLPASSPTDPAPPMASSDGPVTDPPDDTEIIAQQSPKTEG